MALNGSYTIYGSYGVDLVFSWTATQSIDTNTSAVSWKMYLTGYTSNGRGMFGMGTFKINNSTIYEVTIGQPELSNEEASRLTNLQLNTGIITSGTTTINHNTDGTGSFRFSANNVVIGTTPFQLDSGLYGNTIFTLDTINKKSTISATNGYIGEEITIIISRTHSGLTHTLTYTFGKLSGTIATKTASTSIKWVLPSSFYNELVNNKSKTGVITCETFNGSISAGYTTSQFVASVDPTTNAPILSPIVVDVNSTTTALTGDANKLIRYESMVEFRTNAVAQNGATIVSQSVTCGSVTKKDFAIGTIDNVESGTFVFTATDSRGFTTKKTIEKPIINYVKPTCYQEVETTLVDTTGAVISLTISGNYFNGSFGAVNNTYLIEVRYPNADGGMSEWTALPEVMFPTLGDNTYTLDIEINNLSYSQSYNVQSRITDKLHTVQSAVYTIKVLPVFDWSKEDFNLNVPLNINSETVLRHNKNANNTVLSASGGHIYIRPNGTDSTIGETIFNPDGSVIFGGDLDFSAAMPDHIIETGTESMGTNGVWYWAKWKSGKAECYGCRNYGTMAITTAWGNLYRSAVFTQDLPAGLFSDRPDFIGINMIDSTNGGWICKHEQNAPTASNTGSFIYVRPASATASKTNIGFYAIGRWD